jgi:hypothetical protein
MMNMSCNLPESYMTHHQHQFINTTFSFVYSSRIFAGIIALSGVDRCCTVAGEHAGRAQSVAIGSSNSQANFIAFY